MIQISHFDFLHLSQLCTACLLFVLAAESSVLNVLSASGTRLVMAEDCIFVFKVVLRDETICILQKDLLRSIVRSFTLPTMRMDEKSKSNKSDFFFPPGLKRAEYTWSCS